MKKGIVIALFIVLCLGVVSYLYIYQGHRDVSSEKPEVTISALTLQTELVENPDASLEKYLDKVIEVSGKVTEMADSTLVVDNSVFCSFANLPMVKVNDAVIVKGRCIGYDELFEQVKLDQCLIK
ncbi:OB-fold protein [Neptunitalea lumnitzerae]|uniref:tRNA_anti-like n=1 Tax=Neptunitalea lumnitzerae TaxID=2965509 RepID=A0ABQ5MMH5_9FLAO|nr:hypothetical protein [Neptunitalea sp. Y10]GLB50516.1 hypothetical protein Y10_28840 [Neptunitalea sp. Y10]